MMIPLRPTVTAAMIFFLSLLQSYCYAQEKSKVQFGKVGPEDFATPSSPVIDSNSSAVILADIGSVKFIGNGNGWFSHVYRRQTRIRILDKKAMQLATVGISLYTNSDDPEKADNILASTYNLENGKVVETRMDKKDIFEEKEDKHHLARKFTLPAVKVGSIIEYSYTITSDYNFSLPPWEFQSIDYPCLWSEFEVNIPQTLQYIFVRQGVHGYVVDKGSEGHESYKVTDKADSRGGLAAQDRDLFVSANTVKHRWVMKDIPAFHVENYLSSPWNFIDKLVFQLERTYNGEDTRDVMNTWKKATEELMNDETFGQPLREDNEWMDELLNRIATGASGSLEQAKAIYYYMNSHLTCTDHYNKYIKTNLRDVVKRNSGTVGDLNLLLVAMLRKKGFTADPVLLSTREHGFNLAKYPVLSKLNYVIARVSVLGKVYFLDVAHPQLGFGQLAGNCYNGHARIISEKDSASVYFVTDSLLERKSSAVFISNGPKGLEGSFQSILGTQESYNTRERIGEIGVAAYFKSIQTSYGDDLEISNTAIDSLQQPEEPVGIRYEFTIKQSPDASILYFNPLLADAWRENPFKAAERKYPVEMPYAMDEVYVMNMEIPPGYTVDEIPKSAKVAFNGDQGSFEYLVAKQENMIQLRCRVRLNRTVFPPEDYSSLRDFFGFIVKKENEQIVLKKQ